VIGATAEQIERLGALLQRLESVRERAYTDFMRNEYENAVLPTLEDVSFVCDVRPIFEDEVDLSSEGNRAVRHTRILGVTHRVLAVLTTEDPGGKRRRFTFQMGDRTVDELQSALERVRGQLDILKAKISVTHDSK